MAEFTEEEVETFMQKVGERIQQVREFRGMTRRAFGEAMGLKGESANTGIYALEANGRGTRIDTIFKAARILDVSPGFLLDGGDLKVERVISL